MRLVELKFPIKPVKINWKWCFYTLIQYFYVFKVCKNSFFASKSISTRILYYLYEQLNNRYCMWSGSYRWAIFYYIIRVICKPKNYVIFLSLLERRKQKKGTPLSYIYIYIYIYMWVYLITFPFFIFIYFIPMVFPAYGTPPTVFICNTSINSHIQ